jgi:hypothetical protein
MQKAFIEKQLEDLNLKGTNPFIKKIIKRQGYSLSSGTVCGKADSEMFILNSMYADFNKNYIDKAKQEVKKEGKDLSTEALKLLRRLSKMTRQ